MTAGDNDQPVEASATQSEAAEVAAEAADVTAGDTATEGGAGITEEALAERNDQYLRLAADFENFRRRKAQELADRARYASEDAAVALLPVLDNLRRAIEHAPEQGAGPQLVDGLRMVVQQFESALASISVVPVETQGARFDPAVHQAIGGEESEDVEEETVVAELQPGYRLHDRLLRPALVRVAHPRAARPGAAE